MRNSLFLATLFLATSCTALQTHPSHPTASHASAEIPEPVLVEPAQPLLHRLLGARIAQEGINKLDGGSLAITIVCILVLGSLAAGAGIGGGGLFVPIYAYILGAGAKAASPLSTATIFGGAIGNMATIGWMRHPNADRPVIDYEVSTFMQGGELLGVVFGVLLNRMLPEIVIVLVLACVLSYSGLRTVNKARRTFKKETEAFAAAAAKAADSGEASAVTDADGADSTSSNDDEKTTELLHDPDEEVGLGDVDVDAAPSVAALEEIKKPAAATREELLKAHSQQFPVWAWAVVLPMTAFVLIHAVIRKQIDQCESPAGFWLFYFLPVPVLGGCIVYVGRRLAGVGRARTAANYPVINGDVDWADPAIRARFPAVSLLAGVMSGLLGIGGGMIIGPLYMAIGLEPRVASASCAYEILFTASTGMAQYAIGGELGWQLMLLCILIGFISGQAGQRGINAALKRTGRPSIVMFLLGGIVCSAVLVALIFGIIKAVDQSSKDINIWKFSVGDFGGC